jgi:hypothetical protein
MALSVKTRSPSSAVTGPRRAALTCYRWLLLAFLLLGGVQIFLASLADNTVIFGGLHALDGLAILCIAAFLYASARRRARAG